MKSCWDRSAKNSRTFITSRDTSLPRSTTAYEQASIASHEAGSIHQVGLEHFSTYPSLFEPFPSPHPRLHRLHLPPLRQFRLGSSITLPLARGPSA